MSNNYLPPESTNLPFNFTNQGYVPDGNTSILFNFISKNNTGTLRAAINVMQPYWATTHTYAKSCPKYVVGYGSGGIQIIKGRCLFGGIRDLRGVISGIPSSFTTGSLTAYINSVLNTSQIDLSSYCYAIKPEDLSAFSAGHLPKNISGTITGIKPKGFGDLPTFIGGHTPGDVNAYIGVHQPNILPANINSIRRKGIGDIVGLIDTHLAVDLPSAIGAHRPSTLSSVIRVFSGIGGTIGNLPSFIFAEKYKGINTISAQIETHQSINMYASIRIIRTGTKDLSSNIFSWHDSNLFATIDKHLPENLRSSIRMWRSGIKNLRGTIRSWHRGNFADINAIVGVHQPINLQSSIGMHLPINLSAVIGMHTPVRLGVILRTWHVREQKDLLSDVMSWHRYDMSACLGGILPVSLRVYLRAWQQEIPTDLHSSIHSWSEPLSLGALIETHQPNRVSSSIRGWKRETQKNLSGTLRSWQVGYLTAYIATHPYKTLRSSIRSWVRRTTKNLTARILGWQYNNLSGIIDSHTWGLLGATIFPHPPPPLYASIRGWSRNLQRDLHANTYGWQDNNLSGTIGSHRYGNLNVILKSVHLAVINNLRASMHGWQQSDLGVTTKGGHLPSNLGVLLKGVTIGVTKDLRASMHGWQQSDLGVTTKGGHQPKNIIAYINIFQSGYKNLRATTHGWIDTSLPSIIGGHLPSRMPASIRPWYVNNYKSLRAFAYGWDKLELGASIDTHGPGNLFGIIKVPVVNISRLLHAYVSSWYREDLGMILGGTHDPGNLFAKLQVTQRRSSILPALIWALHIRTLTASLNIVFPYDLQSTIGLIPPSDLSAYLKVRPYVSLPASVRGWQDSNLSANIHQIWDKFLPASVYGRTDMKKNLPAKIKGYGSEYKNLQGSIVPFYWLLLGATIRATYLTNMHAYVFAVAPKDLSSKVHAWHERFLQGILNVQNYPWNLTAQIYSTGGWCNFYASIAPRQGVNHYSNLTMSIHPWEIGILSAHVLGAAAPVLSAYINSLGYAHDLHGSIRPKMIRLTTVISIPTQIHNDLSSTINYPCFRTGYSNLLSQVYVKYKSDLYAYIKPIFYNYKPKSLSASVGYTDSYLEVDKIKLSINIYPSEFFTEDKFKLLLKLLDAESLLTAYIRGTLRYNSISARIVGDAIPSYTFDTVLQNREIVIHKTYDGIFKTSETIEMAFKSAVKDYFYSSDGEFAWKSNRFDKWVFDIRSLLPPDISLGMIRRLHKATTIYDLKKFKSIDEAVKAAIAYVTEYPQSTLGASIVNLGTYRMLSSVINPRYTMKSKTILESTITPVGNTIFISEQETISKI